MDTSKFQNSLVRRLVPISATESGQPIEAFAFVPSPLPEEIELDARTWASAINAGHCLGRLDAIARELLPNPTLLSRPTILREAVSTSALEGTYAPAADVLTSEMDAERPRSVAVTEVLNFIAATELGISRLNALPVCTRLARELQAVLVKGTPSEDWQAGNIRETQVILGPYKGRSINEALFVPTPPGPELLRGLREWETWVHAKSDVHPLVRVALAHYQFETLHPFTDGNGRIGRLLAILQLIEYGQLRDALISLSPYFEANSDKYRHLLREVSATGAFGEWVAFFCEGLSVQARDAEQRIRDLLAWKDTTLAMLKTTRAKGVTLDIVAKLIEYPALSVKTVTQWFGVSTQAANTAVRRLENLGILEEVTGRSYSRVFHAPRILEILFRKPQL